LDGALDAPRLGFTTTGGRSDFRVLFVTPPSAGQANPLLSIASEVAGRKNVAVWFSSAGNITPGSGLVARCEKISWRPYTEENAIDNNYADPVKYGSLRAGPLNPAGMRVIIDMVFSVDRVKRDYGRVSALIKEIAPDVMVIDWMAAGAIDAAIAAGVRFIVSIPGLPSSVLAGYLPPGFPSPGSGLRKKMSPDENRKNNEYRRACLVACGKQLLRYRRLRETLGSNAENYYDAGSRAEAILCYSLFEIEYPFPVPRTLHMLGAIAPASSELSDENPVLRRWLENQSSVVLVSFGTLAHFSSAEARALARAVNSISDFSGVLWKLSRRDEALLAQSGFTFNENVHIEPWFSSQHALMQHPGIRAVICHGGANTVHEALYHGKAVLIVPLWLDCHDMAARLLDSGAGVATAGEIRSDDIAHGVARILSFSGYSESAVNISELMRKAGGRKAAADIICSLAPAVSLCLVRPLPDGVFSHKFSVVATEASIDERARGIQQPNRRITRRGNVL